MLDTSRRYFPKESIKSVLYAMSLAKFNAFHWHIVDDDSFPMFVQDYPDLNFNGAFTEAEVYSKETMEEIISYA